MDEVHNVPRDYFGNEIAPGAKIVYAGTQGSSGAFLTAGTVLSVAPNTGYSVQQYPWILKVQRTNLSRWDSPKPVTLRRMDTIVVLRHGPA